MNSKIKRGLRNTFSALITILICVMSVFAIINVTFNFVYIRSEVHQSSMQPTLNKYTKGDEAGDTVYCNKFSKLQRGDIVIASVQWYSEYIIKRLVGMPGDELEIIDEGNKYSLYVNRELMYSRDKILNPSNMEELEKQAGLDEKYNSYLGYLTKHPESVGERENGDKFILLGDDEYFLMGDNWSKSTDSIDHGPAKRSQILGRTEMIIYQEENKFIALCKNMARILFS